MAGGRILKLFLILTVLCLQFAYIHAQSSTDTPGGTTTPTSGMVTTPGTGGGANTGPAEGGGGNTGPTEAGGGATEESFGLATAMPSKLTVLAVIIIAGTLF